MKFTLNWLRQHLETEASLEQILETLPRLGFPVANISDFRQTLAGFRVAEVRDVAPHPNADRLRVCTVWTGEKTLQVICGAPNVTEGMRTVLALPGDKIPLTEQVLQQGVIRGVESQGMLCSYDELGLRASDFGASEGGIIALENNASPNTSFISFLGLDDPVIEIEVTPNRGDMLGVRGIARELAAAGLGALLPTAEDTLIAELLEEFASKGFSAEEQTLEEEENEDEFLDDEGFLEETDWPIFALARVEGVTLTESPQWMQRFLRAIGLKPLSALVDITNYLTHDQARPLHVFDADKIKGEIKLGLSEGGEVFEGLDGKTYTLPLDAYVLLDEGGVISLAGILGGQRTACTEETRNILVECAFFDPEMIMRAGQALGIHTDARARFERGVDPTTIFSGLSQAVTMIEEFCGGAETDVSILEQMNWSPTELSLRLERLETLGGRTVTTERACEILEALGFSPFEEEGIIQVDVPSWRFDVEGEADLVEEVLRIEGYASIPSCPLPFRPYPSALTDPQKRSFEVREELASRGLQEVVTWSFLAPEKARLFAGGTSELVLQNPISRDLSVMRPSILPNLLDLAVSHQNRSLPWPGFFEVGPQYEGIGATNQREVAAGLLSEKTEAHWKALEAVDVFTAKAHVCAALERCGVDLQSLQIQTDAPSWYHPGRGGVLKQGPQILAFFGEIHPALLKQENLIDRLFGFEVFLDALPDAKPRFPKPALELSPYQPVPLDLAFIIDKTVPAEKLLATIQKAGGPNLQHVQIFDVFESDAKIGLGKKSLALRILFQSVNETLTDKFIQERMSAICAEALKSLGAILRDGGKL